MNNKQIKQLIEHWQITDKQHANSWEPCIDYKRPITVWKNTSQALEFLLKQNEYLIETLEQIGSGGTSLTDVDLSEDEPISGLNARIALEHIKKELK